MNLRLYFGLISIVLIGLVLYRFDRPKGSPELINSPLPTVIPSPAASPQPSPLPTALPNHFLITTAFIPQAPEHNWTEPWQDACEEAALLTASDYYHHQNPTVLETKQAILNLIDYETQKGWGIDININQMSVLAHDYFHLNPIVVANPTLFELKKFVSQSHPVIIPAAGKSLFQENHFFSNGGPYYHNLVLLGYDDSTRQFIVHDVGTQHGAYFHYSYDLLLKSIHDFPESGNPADILSGSAKVLVL
ncbi:C39 family peptidase [Patescibacteria group bacterium]|nr:C39 family peptidase [Patescibacteria group bacterium]